MIESAVPLAHFVEWNGNEAVVCIEVDFSLGEIDHQLCQRIDECELFVELEKFDSLGDGRFIVGCRVEPSITFGRVFTALVTGEI